LPKRTRGGGVLFPCRTEGVEKRRRGPKNAGPRQVNLVGVSRQLKRNLGGDRITGGGGGVQRVPWGRQGKMGGIRGSLQTPQSLIQGKKTPRKSQTATLKQLNPSQISLCQLPLLDRAPGKLMTIRRQTKCPTRARLFWIVKRPRKRKNNLSAQTATPSAKAITSQAPWKSRGKKDRGKGSDSPPHLKRCGRGEGGRGGEGGGRIKEGGGGGGRRGGGGGLGGGVERGWGMKFQIKLEEMELELRPGESFLENSNGTEKGRRERVRRAYTITNPKHPRAKNKGKGASIDSHITGNLERKRRKKKGRDPSAQRAKWRWER